MNLTKTLPLAILLAAGACSKSDKQNDQAPAEAAKTVEGTAPSAAAPQAGANTATKVGLDTGGKALGGDATRLQKLKFGGAGFDAEYNEALDGWHIEKWEAQDDGMNDNVVSIYLDNFDSEWPNEMEAFATKLQTPDFLDFGSKWTKITKKTASDTGWVVTGEWSDGEDTEAAFAVYSAANATLCRGTVKASAKDPAASVSDAIAACQASTLQ
jgi:predicted outer membrane protein